MTTQPHSSHSTNLDTCATIEPSAEWRDFARVVKRAIGVIVVYWAATLPQQHPYRQAARMVVSYLERRYGV